MKEPKKLAAKAAAAEQAIEPIDGQIVLSYYNTVVRETHAHD